MRSSKQSRPRFFFDGREARGDEILRGHDALWHVMLYAGNGMVIGACDIGSKVTIRPIDYGEQRWWFVVGTRPPFRTLEREALKIG